MVLPQGREGPLDGGPVPEAEAAPEAEAGVEPPAGPTLDAAPVAVAAGEATVTLTGEGFEPGELVATVACDTPPDPDIVFDPDLDAEALCDFGTLAIHEVDPGGEFHTHRSFLASEDVLWVAVDDTAALAYAAVVVQEPDPATEPAPAPTTTTRPAAAPTTTSPPPTTTTTAAPPTPTTTTTAPAAQPECPDGEHAHDDLGCHPDDTASEQVPLPPDDWYCVPVSEGVVECSDSDDYICADTDEGRVCEPKDEETAARLAAEPEPEPEPAAWLVGEPLEQCASDVGWYGAGRVSVLAGTTAAGYYEPVVRGGSDSCERIKAWWGEITAGEAERMWQGQYPCEYASASSDWEGYPDANGPALLAGCWPRLLEGGHEKALRDKGYDTAHVENNYILPPNEPPLVAALYGCYRDALSGPPPGWTSPGGGEWMTVHFCPLPLTDLGNPVRYLGVTAECAAEQYTGQVAEHKARDRAELVRDGERGLYYVGDYSWANCETHADRLLPAELRTASFRQRCEAVIDAAAREDENAADAAAEGYGLSRADYLAEMKAMHCAGTAENLKQYPQFHGEWVVSWLPQEGSVCFQAALLNAARTAVYDQATKAKFC